MQGAVKRQVTLFGLHEGIRRRALRQTHVRVLVGDVRVVESVHPLGEGHAATSRHQAVATVQRRGVAARVGFNLLIVKRSILGGSTLGEGSLSINRFGRTGGLCELLILVAKDASRANRRHIKTGGRNQCQLGRNIQQLQHRLERQGVARIAQVRVQAAAGNGISLHAKHRHDISDALLDFVLIGTENL